MLFSYFSYSFSLASTPIETWDLSIDKESFYSAGILLGEFDEINVTWSGLTTTFYTFTMNETDVRVTWMSRIVGDSFYFEQHIFVFGTGIGWYPMKMRDYGNQIWNTSVINEWNNNTKASQFSALKGYEIFFTDPEKLGNITRAVYDDGTVGIILAETANWRDPNMISFISWYANIVTGTNSYGLPPQFNIVVQLITALSILSLALIVKEMLRL